MNPNFLTPLKKVSESGKIASFYGFSPVVGPVITKKDLEMSKDMDENWHPSEKAALIREYGESKANYLPQPLMLFMERPMKGTSERKNPNKAEAELIILNSNKSITEALLIQASRAILENAGWKNTRVRLNSVGSKDSIAEFERKTQNFLRKKIADLPGELRQFLKKDHFYLARSKEEKWGEFKDSSPQTLDSLNEESRVHFKEVLEFLEICQISYDIDTTLLGDLSYACDTVFEIVSEDGETVLGRGCRWNRLSKKLQQKKEIPAVSVTISAKALRLQKITVIKEIAPKFFLVQFGPEAKLRSLLVLERLRKTGLAVLHALAKDKLVGQIVSAETMNVPYIILLGQKEALENSVVIRNTSTRSQTTVPILELHEYIKKIK